MPERTYLALDEEAQLPDDLLVEAVQAFFAAGDREKLGLATPTQPGGASVERLAAQVVQRRMAEKQRVHFARTSVLSAALAVEAAANLYIARALPEDVDTLDRLDTVGKLLIAPRLASGVALFESGREPLGLIKRLFALRNRVVHPKLGKQAVVGAPGRSDFTPLKAAESFVAAAEVLIVLSDSLPARTMPVHGARLVLKERTAMRDAGRRYTDSLPKPPSALERALAELQSERVGPPKDDLPAG